jgi:hypothetical protein
VANFINLERLIRFAPTNGGQRDHGESSRQATAPTAREAGGRT